MKQQKYQAQMCFVLSLLFFTPLSSFAYAKSTPIPLLHSDLENSNLKKTFTSKGLTKVTFTFEEGLKPLVISQDGEARVDIITPSFAT